MQLPEANLAPTRARLLRRCAGAGESVPPADVQRAIEAIVALLLGERCDLSAIVLDIDDVPAFHRCVYDAARDIPPGATATYGTSAARLGEARAARAVGQALGRNPFPIVIPCHRVLTAGWAVFPPTGEVATKLKLLAIEGAVLALADPPIARATRHA